MFDGFDLKRLTNEYVKSRIYMWKCMIHPDFVIVNLRLMEHLRLIQFWISKVQIAHFVTIYIWSKPSILIPCNP
jgi:hypothetical protein